MDDNIKDPLNADTPDSTFEVEESLMAEELTPVSAPDSQKADFPRFETAAEAKDGAAVTNHKTPALPVPDAATKFEPAAKKASTKKTLTAKQRLRFALQPRFTRAQVLSALLVGLLGFALVVQLQSSSKDDLAGLRQNELINLLDEVTRRTDSLEAEERRLNALVAELESGQNTQEVARKAAEESAQVQGILSGRLPAEGPGVEISLHEGDTAISGTVLFNVLEELRNAGAEAMQVNGVRLVASSYFASEPDGTVTINGIAIRPPYVWYAIGDPNTIQPALEIPGGAMPQVRAVDGHASVTQLDKVEVSAIAELSDPEFAKLDESDD